jgi:ribosomal protein L13
MLVVFEVEFVVIAQLKTEDKMKDGENFLGEVPFNKSQNYFEFQKLKKSNQSINQSIDGMLPSKIEKKFPARSPLRPFGSA